MKAKIIFTVILFSIIGNVFSQELPGYKTLKVSQSRDSTLIKTVKDINETIRNRVNESFPPHSLAAYMNYVIIEKEGAVPIDSLYKYSIKDFKSIVITYGEPAAVYGGKTDYGLIKLVRK